MTHFNWTSEHSRILRRMAADGANSQEVAAAIGCTTKLALSALQARGRHAQARDQPGKFAWTPEKEATLVARYESEPAIDIARDVGCSLSRCTSAHTKLGCRKTTEFAREITRRRWAEGRHDASLEALEKAAAGTGVKGNTGLHLNCREPLPPGQMPHNHAPIGSLRIAGGHLQRKVGDFPGNRKAQLGARAPTGVGSRAWPGSCWPCNSLPRGRHTMVEAEITPDRLECVTRRENMQRNSRHNRYPPELNQLIQLRGCLNRKINSRAGGAAK